MKIRIVDFQKINKIQKHYGQEWGEYRPDTDEILIDRRCKKHATPSYLEILLHEKGHRLIHKEGWEMSAEAEEAFCDLYAIIKYPRSRLSGYELLVRDRIMDGLNWTTGRNLIFDRMFLEIG